MSVKLILVLGLYLFCWQRYKLRRRLSGFGHVALIVTLVGILSVAVLARVVEYGVFEGVDRRWLGLTGNLLVLVPCVALYLFHLAVERYAIVSVRVLATLGTAVAVAVALSGITVLVIREDLPLSYSIATFEHPLGAVYYLLAGGYYGFLLFSVGVWMVKYTRNKDRHFRRGVRITSVGVFTMAGLCWGRIVPVVVVALGGPKIIAPAFLLGGVSAACAPFIFGGLSYPIVAYKANSYRIQWGNYSALRPLWATCEAVRPETNLGRHWSITSKLMRRRTECYDVIARLLRQDNSDLEGRARIAADALLRAIRRFDERHPGNEWDTILSNPRRGQVEEDTRLLIELSDILQDVLRDTPTPAVK